MSQHKFMFPWTYDNQHLYFTVLCSQNKASGFQAKSNNRFPSRMPLSAQIVNKSLEGKTICKNFHKFRGCNLDDCEFVHVCNRKISGGQHSKKISTLCFEAAWLISELRTEMILNQPPGFVISKRTDLTSL